MNQKIFAVLLFLAVFAVTFLLLRDGMSSPAVPDREPDRPVAEMGNRGESERIRTSAQARAGATENKRSTVDTTATDDARFGIVAVEVATDDGMVPADVKIGLYPEAGARSVAGNGRVEFREVPPGIYTVQVSAEEYLPQPVPAVNVTRGTRTDVRVAMSRAVLFAGVVTDETQGRPIEGASIDFNGMMRAVSGPDGRFRTTARVLPAALDVIRVHHPDFDSQHFLRMPITDIANIRLAMGRGRGTIEGRLIPIGRRELPGRFIARVLRPLEGKDVEVRREIVVVGKDSFRIEGVYEGLYVLEVEFPGSALAGCRESFDLTAEPERRKAFEFRLPEGANVTGTASSRAGANAGVTIALVDADNHVRARAVTGASGAFAFEAVPAGEWRYRVDGRVPTTWSPPFVVEEGRSVAHAFELESGSLKN